MKSETKRLILAVAGAAAIIGYMLLLWRGPWWIDGAHLRDRDLQPADGVVITGFRTMLVAVGAGAIAALGLYYTHRNHRHAEKLYGHSQEQFAHARDKDREQAELTREGQVTERYVEAIKLVGSENLTERLGGIYSLERIMADSEKDHSTVMAVLAAFIRQRAPAADLDAPSLDEVEEHVFNGSYRPDDEIQAALTVLLQRPNRSENTKLNLSRTDLRGANLRHANLDRADLSYSRLDGADMKWSRLRHANLSGTVLNNADLLRADLSGTSLHHTQMARCELSWASLKDVSIFSIDALLSAMLSKTTSLPTPALENPRIAARVRECDTSRIWIQEPNPEDY
ncbi:pentapeptide repeat-containing protein [Streptomyces sp. BH105]|uniref:pentapeptide repeat-containing protein n=1 Tax=Streptomyces sp. BH105 TaxID=3410408 RepID=UPI003CF38993